MKLIKKFLKSKIFYTGIFLVLFLLPSAIYASAETEKRAVVTALGIDKIGKEIELSVNVVIPNGGGANTENVQSLSGKGVNISTALNSLSLSLGKIVGLAHCEVIVLSNNILNEDVIKYLDYFIRSNNLSTNSSLVCTPNAAKEVIEASSTDNNTLALNLKNIVDFNDEFLFTTSMTVETFYQEYFSYSQLSYLNVVEVLSIESASTNDANQEIRKINLEIAGLGRNLDSENSSSDAGNSSSEGESSQSSGGSGSEGESSTKSEKQKPLQAGIGEQTEGSSQSGGSGGGESGGGESGGGESGGKQKKKITNSGKVAVLKKGKKVRELLPEEIAAYNYISRETQKGSVVVGDINNQYFEDATLTFQIVDKKIKHNIFFNNGIPIYKINLNLVVKLDEVNMKNYDINTLDSVKDFTNNKIIEKMENKIKSNFAIAVNEARKNNLDMFEIYKKFNAYHNSDWRTYLKQLEKPKEYMRNILFELDIKITGKF